MDSPSRPTVALPAPPGTPLARRVAPTVKLRRACCSRCSKVLDRAGPPTCDATATKKCSRCARLHKECKPFPVEFNTRFNSLVRAAERLGVDEDEDSPEVAAFTTAQRQFVKELDAFVRMGVKHGGTRKPKGDELTLLLVKGIDRVGTALEGLLDLARHIQGLPPLGAGDAQSDPGSDSPGPASRSPSESFPPSRKRRRAVKPTSPHQRRAGLRKRRDTTIMVSSEAEDEEEEGENEDGDSGD